jgi:hypothetical protein
MTPPRPPMLAMSRATAPRKGVLSRWVEVTAGRPTAGGVPTAGYTPGAGVAARAPNGSAGARDCNHRGISTSYVTIHVVKSVKL